MSEVKSRRPSPARRSAPARRPGRRRASPGGVISYRSGRASVALFLFALAFGLLWLLNGSFTAQFVMAVTGKDALVGWSAHLVITAIEIAPAALAPYLRGLPRRVVVALWLLSLPFGVFDVLSSAVGIAPWLVWTGAEGSFAHLLSVIIAEVIGFLPERMIMWLAVVAQNILRSPNE